MPLQLSPQLGHLHLQGSVTPARIPDFCLMPLVVLVSQPLVDVACDLGLVLLEQGLKLAFEVINTPSDHHAHVLSRCYIVSIVSLVSVHCCAVI